MVVSSYCACVDSVRRAASCQAESGTKKREIRLGFTDGPTGRDVVDKGLLLVRVGRRVVGREKQASVWDVPEATRNSLRARGITRQNCFKYQSTGTSPQTKLPDVRSEQSPIEHLHSNGAWPRNANAVIKLDISMNGETGKKRYGEIEKLYLG